MELPGNIPVKSITVNLLDWITSAHVEGENGKWLHLEAEGKMCFAEDLTPGWVCREGKALLSRIL